MGSFQEPSLYIHYIYIYIFVVEGYVYNPLTHSSHSLYNNIIIIKKYIKQKKHLKSLKNTKFLRKITKNEEKRLKKVEKREIKMRFYEIKMKKEKKKNF